MNLLTLDDPIVDWAVEYPEAIPLFESHGIDYMCGGKSLRYACQQRQLDPATILAQLSKFTRAEESRE